MWIKIILISITTLFILVVCSGTNVKKENTSLKEANERSYSLSLGLTPFGISKERMEKIVDKAVEKISEGADIYLAVALWNKIDDPLAVHLFERGINKAREKGLKVSLYLDITNPNDRATIAIPSHVTYKNLSWEDEMIRSAYKEFVLLFTKKYRPEYIGLGVEMETLYIKNPSEFIAYASLANSIAKELKTLYPEIFIYVSVQYDKLINLFPESKKLKLFDHFNKYINLGLSLYPWQFYSKVSDIPKNYLEKAYNTKKPIYIAETSWPSAYTELLPGSPEEQQEFVNWLHNEASKGNISVITWWSINDFESPGDPLFGLWSSQGLFDKKFNEKPAWRDWIGSKE